MLPYIITFAISCFCIFIYERMKKKNKFILIIGLLLPCILAGLRAENIGTDILVYAKSVYKCANDSISFNDFMQMRFYDIKAGYWFTVKNMEFGYTTTVYILAKLFHNFQIVLFATSVLIVFPIYYGLKKYSFITEKKLLYFSMFVFYMLIYTVTLNLMRQSIAVAILFYAISLVINDKKNSNIIKYLLLNIVAILFHKSAFIGIIFFAFYNLTKSRKKTKYLIINNKKIGINTINFMLLFITSIIVIFVPGLAKKIVNLLSYIIGKDYSGYVWDTIGIVKTTILILPILIIYIIKYRKINNFDYKKFLLIMNILYIATVQFGSTTSFGGRISLYFQIFNVILYPILYNSFKYKISKFMFVLYLIIWWSYYLTAGDTYPYIFYFTSTI